MSDVFPSGEGTMNDLQVYVDALNVSKDNVHFTVSIMDTPYGDCEEVFVCWTEQESDEEFAKRLEKHKKAYAEYVAWCREHKDDIEKEMARREAAAASRKDDKIKKLEEQESRARQKAEELAQQLEKARAKQKKKEADLVSQILNNGGNNEHR